MIPRTQLFRHDPQKGVLGDCYRAALASILNLRIESVPHFGADEVADPSKDWDSRIDEFLARYGLVRIVTYFDPAPGLDAILKNVSAYNRGILFHFERSRKERVRSRRRCLRRRNHTRHQPREGRDREPVPRFWLSRSPFSAAQSACGGARARRSKIAGRIPFTETMGGDLSKVSPRCQMAANARSAPADGKSWRVRDLALHRLLRDALQRGELPPEPVRDRIITALERAEIERSLDKGFGLSPTWWQQDAHLRRDELIVAAHERFFHEIPLRQAGIKIVGIARELQSRRIRTVIPDTAEEIIQAAIETGAAFPTDGRRVADIIRPVGNKGGSRFPIEVSHGKAD